MLFVAAVFSHSLAVHSCAMHRVKTDFFEYLEVVQRSLGQSCAGRVTAANKQIEAMVSTPQGRAQLKEMFNLCDIPLTADDVATFLECMSSCLQCLFCSVCLSAA